MVAQACQGNTLARCQPSRPFQPCPGMLSMWMQEDALLKSSLAAFSSRKRSFAMGHALRFPKCQTTPHHTVTSLRPHDHGTTRQRRTAAWTLKPCHRPCRALLAGEQGRLHQQLGDHVGVQVGRRPAVLKVAALLHGHAAPHAHRRAAVGHAPAARTRVRVRA